MIDIQVVDRPASQSFYAVAGRLLFIETFDRHLAARIERLFSGWQLTPVSVPDRSPDIQITLAAVEHLPEVPRGLTEFAVAEGGRCYKSSAEYFLQLEASLLRLHETKPVCVSVAVCGPTEVELARVTSFAVCAALRRYGLFELHAAGLVVPNSEDGLLIVGPSGSGKSTLAVQLATAGWGYLSDDEVLLSAVGEEVEARGFRSFFAIFTAAATAGSPSGLKTRFEPAGQFTAAPASRVAPRFVLFASISGTGATQLRKLDQAATMTRLIRSCPWATYDTAIAGANLNLLSGLARQATAFDLDAGTDLLEPRQASRIIRAACDV